MAKHKEKKTQKVKYSRKSLGQGSEGFPGCLVRNDGFHYSFEMKKKIDF